MNKINNYILAIFGLFAFVSCNEDDSTLYETELNKLNIEGVLENYTVLTGIDTLRINPNVDSEQHDDLAYYWFHFITNASISQINEYDTISFEKDLEYPISLKPDGYTLVFCIEDLKNGVKEYRNIDLSVETSKSRGWYILKGSNGFTDIDIFNDERKIENALFSINGRSLKGAAKQIGWTNQYNWQNPESNLLEKQTRCLALLSDEDFSMMRIDDSKELNQLAGMFVGESNDPVKPNFWISHAYGLFLGNNENIYSINSRGANTGRFGYAKATGYDYQLSDHFICSFRDTKPIVFDKVQSTFYAVDEVANDLLTYNDKASYPSKNLNVDPIYMGYQHGGGNGRGLGIILMKDRSNPDELQLVSIDMVKNSPYGRLEEPFYELEVLPQGLELANADHFAVNKDFDLLYYTKTNTISFYDMGNQTEEVIYSLPAGEEISFIKHYKYTERTSYDFDKLVVASHSGGNYKVYLFDMQAGKPAGTPQMMEGEGVVGDLMYVSPRINQYEYRH